MIPGAGKWEHMTNMKLDSLTYTAWRRRLPVSLSALSSYIVRWTARPQPLCPFACKSLVQGS